MFELLTMTQTDYRDFVRRKDWLDSLQRFAEIVYNDSRQFTITWCGNLQVYKVNSYVTVYNNLVWQFTSLQGKLICNTPYNVSDILQRFIQTAYSEVSN